MVSQSDIDRWLREAAGDQPLQVQVRAKAELAAFIEDIGREACREAVRLHLQEVAERQALRNKARAKGTPRLPPCTAKRAAGRVLRNARHLLPDWYGAEGGMANAGGSTGS